MKAFEDSYKKLNTNQKIAVESTEGPVMVIAGPGTGKTDVLTLRIAHILKENRAKPDEILCLTFTNSGVKAMRERLLEYIGVESNNIFISTFHSFAINLVEKNYDLFDFENQPKLLPDDEAVFIVDQILHENEWEYLKPRSNPNMYFGEIKQLISLLKRESISANKFLEEINIDINKLKSDPENVSSRGETKGSLKKEIEKKIQSLFRTKEVVKFYQLYEIKKRELSLMDYDDVLEYAVFLVEEYENIRADIYENYQYILIDEHQDSSGIQNRFLKAVWGNIDSPNIFVVGDDRQLIYGFSGAKLSYFEEFSSIFSGTKVVTLNENYRSSSPILNLADELLKSSITQEILSSNKKGKEPVTLSEYNFPRDEIIGAGLFFKQKIKEGLNPKECALLVPRNYHIREAIDIFESLDIPVSQNKKISLFSAKQTEVLLRVLGIISNPNNSKLLAHSLLDLESNILPIEAHSFLRNKKPETLTLEDLIFKNNDNLFSEQNSVIIWGNKLKNWINLLSNKKITQIINIVGDELFIKNQSSSNFLENVEVIRSFNHLAILFEEKNKKASLSNFLEYINRLESYNTHIELSKFGTSEGVEIMTLHKSKGLQYECVWIAHMNQEIMMSDKKSGFTLPQNIKKHVEDRSLEMAKRELYVAITRAKLFCNISYAKNNYSGAEMEVIHSIRDIDTSFFIKKDLEQTENHILSFGADNYIKTNKTKDIDSLDQINKLVKENYKDIKVSVTMLNNFFQCPWKWYFRNFLRLPEVKSSSLALGSSLHSAIELILKNKTYPENIEEVILYNLEKNGIENKIDLNKFKKEALTAINNWYENSYPKLEKDFISERSIQFRDPRFPHLLIYGKIDLTEKASNGDIYVTDFKTGKSKNANTLEKIDEEGRLSDYMRQLTMYSYLINNKEKGSIVKLSRLMFVESEVEDKNAIFEIYIDQEKIDLLIKDITEYDDSLKNGKWLNRQCKHSGYGEQTMCEYCELSKSIFS